MGGLFGGSTKTKTTEKSNSGPSEFQKPYVTEAFNAAQDIYQGAKGTEAYQGDTYAGMTDEAKATLDRMKAWAGSTGVNAGNQISALGSQMIGDNSGKATTNLDRFTAMAGEDPRAGNMAAAAEYAANPYVDGIIDANSRDITRNLHEEQLPGIDRAASGTGNINSSRAGIASGIAQRGAADRIGDISAQVRGDAYESGLDRASRDRTTSMDAFGRAADSYAGLTNNGISAIRAGTDVTGSAYDIMNQAELVQQVDAQGGLDALKLKWQEGDTRAMDLLARYASVVAGTQWGASGTAEGTSKTKNSGNIFGQLAGAAASAASIYTGMK